MPPRKGAWQPGRLRYGEMRNVYARRFRRGDYAKRFTRGGYAKHLRAARSGEADLLRGLVPDGLLLVLEGEGGHVAADGGLLADGRRRDGLFLALHAQDEVTEVSEDAVVGLVDVLAAEREGLAALDVFGRLAAEEHRDEFQRELAKLRDAAPTVSFKQMRRVIEEDLEQPISDVRSEERRLGKEGR